MDLTPLKGTRDFSPSEKMIRQEVVDLLREIFERYGFAPIETPITEQLSVLTAKFAAGENSDAFKEIFKVTDQGGRKLGLRFDLTVPLARYVGKDPTLKMPFKRYEIGRVYRDGPIKLGRYREFWQCDVDTVGCKSMLADYECLQIAVAFFKGIGLKASIEVNNRKILTGILEAANVKKNLRQTVIISIDKLKKLELKAFLRN